MLREIVSNEWFTIFIVFGLVLITMSKFLFAKRFEDFLQVIGNSKYLKIYERDQKFIDGFDTLLFLNLVFGAATFSYIAYSTVISPIKFEIITFLKVVFGVAALILMKVLFERLIASLFEIDRIIDSYLFQKTSYLNFSGFILLPINVLLIFTLEPSKTIIYIVLAVLLLINLIGLFTSFKNYQKLIINNLFYFILYLCALEIGPYLILYKLIIEY
ncbi:DUF4271 domain-containing protein [Aquaticitalea lipolytica]|uniref:DUF4271 domain-containing protein n=1 Tax=Aquaticitalea lipolytica TaxID=1247562 RepID=A0A8J2TR72_9FLAO|nr:DUF4271 domain-containing protein [Aquaticitalea lipolytica]GFZ82259.1 DUF4271 domain-containing protein [Aquaticitalea lipolytica]